jgi:lysophospholipase
MPLPHDGDRFYKSSSPSMRPFSMHLVATPDNPIPNGAITAMARASDGVRLRTARWVPTTAVRGTVAVLGGRAEFIEKYFEVVRELLARGFAVAMIDWRGQGGSERQLKNPRKGHIDDFSIFERDVSALVEDVLGPSCPQPWFGLCHSMGAAIMLSIAHEGRCPFERLVLTAPMIGLAGLRYPKAARALAETLDALGLGGMFSPGGNSTSISTMPFANNVLTSDPVRYARSSDVIAAEPSLGLGWPTVGWVHAAFRLMSEFAEADYPRQLLTPALVVASGADRVIDIRAIERFATRLKAGRMVVIEGARHEILVERDDLRDLFWAAFDQFIPGVEGAKAAAAKSLEASAR